MEMMKQQKSTRNYMSNKPTMSIKSLLFLQLSPMIKNSSSSLQIKRIHSIFLNNVCIHPSYKQGLAHEISGAAKFWATHNTLRCNSFVHNKIHKKLRHQSLSTNMTMKPLKPSKSFSRQAISQTLESTANLASLLPSGTLLAFELLTPIFTNDGSCDTTMRPMTLILLSILAGSCFLGSFTDSIKASDGQIYHGLATMKGLWIFDYPAASASGIPDDLSKYRVNIVDVVHAVSSVFVFLAIALKDSNVVQCFYPSPDHKTSEILDIVPIGMGLICSLLFVVFPSRRKGIGYPDKKEHF